MNSKLFSTVFSNLLCAICLVPLFPACPGLFISAVYLPGICQADSAFKQVVCFVRAFRKFSALKRSLHCKFYSCSIRTMKRELSRKEIFLDEFLLNYWRNLMTKNCAFQDPSTSSSLSRMFSRMFPRMFNEHCAWEFKGSSCVVTHY